MTALDVEDSPSGHRQRVGDQRAVASPRHRLGTHDGRGAPGRELLETREARGEALALHVVRIPSKGRVAPAEIDGVGTRVAQPAQRLHVPIAYLDGVERARERRAVELRIVTRPGNGAHVDHLLHSVSAEQLHELPRGARGVPDRVESAHRAARPPRSHETMRSSQRARRRAP
jgi:hypothetical protein